MATTYDKASLVMIPSGYKDDKLYSIKPTDGSGDFTFSRDGAGASPATRVNASGLIEKGRTNELLYSQDFTNAAWIALNATKTTGQTDPNGGSTAVKIISTAVVNSGLYQQDVSGMGSGLIRTSSVWLKGEVGGEVVQFGDATNRTEVTLTTDWVRYEGFASDDSTYFVIYNIGSVQTWYAAFAQYEDGLVATDYIETTTAPVSAGLLGDMPRLDYSGGATCPSLLLEPSRVNVVTQSEYFGASDWTKIDASVEANSVTSPEGFLNAYKIADNANNNQHSLFDQLTTTSGADYTASVFVKKGTLRYVGLQQFYNAGNGAIAFFDIQEGTLVYSQALTTGVFTFSIKNEKIESFGDGWYRISATFNSSTNIAIGLVLADSEWTSGNSYTNTYVGNGDYLYAYGFQTEQASYPTSYIPTYGSASVRGGDDAIVNYTDISNTGGTLFYQGFAEISSDSHLIALSDGAGATGTNRVLFYRSISDNKIWLYIQSAGVSVKNIALELPTDANDKLAVAWATNDFAVYINGVQEYTSSTGAIPTGMQYIQFNEWNNVHEEKNEIKQALYFPTRLTNAELAALTA